MSEGATRVTTVIGEVGTENGPGRHGNRGWARYASLHISLHETGPSSVPRFHVATVVSRRSLRVPSPYVPVTRRSLREASGR